MSLLDRTHILTYAKWFVFIICTIGFGWKVSDSFISFLSRDIGTKTDLKANYEADLPGKLYRSNLDASNQNPDFLGFAVCRHPNQILNLFLN